MAPQDFMQGDGGPPSTLMGSRWPGDRGVGVSRHRFLGGAYVATQGPDHLIFMQPHALARVHCQVGDRRLTHSARPWNVTIAPAGLPARAETSHDVETLVLAIPATVVATATADDTRPGAHLIGRLAGRDDALRNLGFEMAREAQEGHPGGGMRWHELTDLLVDHLVGAHSTSPPSAPRGRLSAAEVGRIRDYVMDNIADPITVEDVARLVGRGGLHFSRVFSASTGLTPHRYIMWMRLSHALNAIRHGRAGLAEAASASGFSDQSHMANWTRRVYGSTITHLIR